MNGYSTRLELRIDWDDMDLFGHVNNLAILRYVQAARVNYLEIIGLMQSQAKSKIGPILASTSCRFRKPLYYPGQVRVFSKADQIKNSSFRISHAVFNDKNEIAAEAEDIIVLFDFRQNTKLTIPDEIRKKIEKLEKMKPDNA